MRNLRGEGKMVRRKIISWLLFAGMTAGILTTAAFESWYEKTCEALKAFEN